MLRSPPTPHRIRAPAPLHTLVRAVVPAVLAALCAVGPVAAQDSADPPVAREAEPVAPDEAARPLLGCALDPPPPLAPREAGTPEEVIDITSGLAEFRFDGPATFSDRLVIRRGDAQLGADEARYDGGTGEFSISGDVEFRDPATRVRGDAASYDARSGRLQVDGADFDLYTLPARGSAEQLRVEEARLLTLTDVTYTSCARGNDDWLLKAGRLTIDREKGTATARNARLEFMGVPILYTPYLTYPVTDARKSGLLLPEIGRSQQRGLELEVPYYINIAPNMDATVAPRYMARRGTQARGEFRYLGRGSHGTLTGEFLPDDDVADDDRALVSWFNQTALPGNWRATIDATDVSDGAYFEDLYTGLSNTSQTHVRRRLDLELYDDAWSVLLRVDDYETLDELIALEDRPYRRLPQLAATGFWPASFLGLDYRVDSELAWFDRSTGVTGLRAHLSPELALPVRVAGFDFRASAALDHTRYRLNDTAPGEAGQPDRTVPVYSAELGTVLERSAGRGGRWIHTLEPRAQYVYVPFRDQSDLPVFDTVRPDFNVVQLFRENRYVGLDRLGDTEQLNLGVTTRLLRARDGSQFLTGTIGTAFYFSDREVVLPDEEPSDANSSDYLAELGMNIADRWSLDLGYQWDAENHETRLAEARVLFHPDDLRVLHLSYRFRRDNVKEIDVAGAWPLGERWSLVGRYNYSLEDNEPLERFVGVEYSTCCWGVRVTARRNLISRDGESDTAISVQLLLAGFSSPGSPAERMLERGILGYDRFDRY